MDNIVEVSVELKGRIILPVTFKVKFMLELDLLYIIFNMAASYINKMSIQKENEECRCHCVKKKTCLTVHRHCHIFVKVNIILSVSCNNEDKLKATL